MDPDNYNSKTTHSHDSVEKRSCAPERWQIDLGKKILLYIIQTKRSLRCNTDRVYLGQTQMSDKFLQGGNAYLAYLIFNLFLIV